MREEPLATLEAVGEAGYAERRRLGRDLHDGAQQAFVAAALSVRLAQCELSGEPRELVEAALEQVQAGLTPFG